MTADVNDTIPIPPEVERAIDQWAGEAFKRGFASSWHYTELWRAIEKAIPNRAASVPNEEEVAQAIAKHLEIVGEFVDGVGSTNVGPAARAVLALLYPPCPRPVNSAPEGQSSADCIARGDCGCDLNRASSVPSDRDDVIEECAKVAESKMDRTRRSHIIAAAIRALKSAPCSPDSGWQPIATAPEDGTSVIVSNGTSVGEAKYHEDAGWYWAGSDPTDYWDGAAYQITHWQPLPAPPITSGQREGENG